MAKRPEYTLVFAPETRNHLRAFEPKHHPLIRQTIAEQLSHTPDSETRNRKPLELPAAFGATWELRFGPLNTFRVLYKINLPAKEVRVLALGIKRGNRLVVGDEEIEL